jgi:alkylation response protein AidB-like acyl-CoA dehydrogenase
MTKNPSMKDIDKAKQDSMDLAEDSREKEWHHPSFVAELFAGRYRHDLINPYLEQDPKEKAEGDEYIAKLQKFALEKIDADGIDTKQKYPTETLDGLKQIGAFGMKISKEYGGLGFSQTNYVRALEMLSGHCGSTVGFLSAHQSIGAPQPLKLFGTPEQKKKFLPRLTKEISAFALTEPNVGSDPAKMTTTATPSADGKYFTLSGTKLWCTNGAVADILIVMARTPDKVENGKSKKQITAFLVEKNAPGFKVLHRCMFMGLNGFENALLEFDNVKVPIENVVGGVGNGLKLALVTLNAGRLSIPGMCVGIGKKCLETLRYWTNAREQWGTKIGNHEEVAEKTAKVAAGTYAMEAMTYWTTELVDRGGQDIRLEAAIAKLFCTELCWDIVHQTIQVRGGRGFERADSLKVRGEVPIPIERVMRDIRINTILEGSTEIMHLFIAREALDMHMRLARDIIFPGASFGKKLATLAKCAAFYSYWYPKQWLHWSYFPLFADFGRLAGHVRYIRRTSHKLARTIFHVMILNGPKLERRQLILGRIVEIGSELFAMAAACSRAHAQAKKGGEGAEQGEFLADLFSRQARKRIDAHFCNIWSNHDAKNVQASKLLMNGDLRWMEKGVIKGNVEFPKDFSV